MALDLRGAALALHRFGFGPRPGSIAAIAPDPRAAVLKGLLKDHLRLDDDVLAAAVFPDSSAVKPIAGLVG
jgi:uncharacterized protein (DUF1800 family)